MCKGIALYKKWQRTYVLCRCFLAAAGGYGPPSKPLILFDVQKILVGIHGQLAAGRLVAGDDGAVVHLKGGAGPLLAYAALHRRRQRPGLIVPVDEDQDLFGIRHRADAYRQGLSGDLFRIVAEEAAVYDAGIRCEIPHAGAGGEAGISAH